MKTQFCVLLSDRLVCAHVRTCVMPQCVQKRENVTRLHAGRAINCKNLHLPLVDEMYRNAAATASASALPHIPPLPTTPPPSPSRFV